MFLEVGMPEAFDYYAFLDGERQPFAKAANEEEGWIDRYVMLTDTRPKTPIEIERVYGKVELRHK